MGVTSATPTLISLDDGLWDDDDEGWDAALATWDEGDSHGGTVTSARPATSTVTSATAAI